MYANSCQLKIESDKTKLKFKKIYLQVINIDYKYIHITWAYSETQPDNQDGASRRNNQQKAPY